MSTDNETVSASSFANYPGDVTESVVGAMMGPNNLGEVLMAVSAEYDAEKGKTRVGFHVAPFPRQASDVWPPRKPNQQVHPGLLAAPIGGDRP